MTADRLRAALRPTEIAWVKAAAREVDLVPGGIFDIAHRAILALEARAALAVTPDAPLDVEHEISLVGAEALGRAVAGTPWPPAEGDTMGETETGHGAVVLARLYHDGWALVPRRAATLDHREPTDD